MSFRVKTFVCVVLAGAVASLLSARGHPALQWSHFFVYLLVILVSSGMKVALPKSEGTMSVDFPFIFLAILQLSPLQAAVLGSCSVVAQSRVRVIRGFTLIQILFNVANVATATVCAWYVYARTAPLLHHENAPALALAATAYFFVNTIPVALVIAWDSRTSPWEQWRQDYPWYLPFYLAGAMLAAAANLIEIKFGWLTALLLIPAVYIVYRAYAEQMAIIRDRERHAAEMEALHLRTIEGLAMAVEAKDENTHRHLMRVRIYVAELGKLMGLDEPVMKALETAAFLHDIGKLAIPEHILNKPGKLTREEFEKMKIHTVVGADILERVKFPYPVVPIVRSHHEAWDGSGYPDGLKGQEIPIGARILTVVDCFDALASDRPYRRAMPLEEAMKLVKSKAGIQFDPAVVELLGQHHERLEELARQRIEDVEPLQTDISIKRGAAPGAGFESGQEISETGKEAKQVPASTPMNHLTAPTVEQKQLQELCQLFGTATSARETSAMFCRCIESMIPFDCFAVYVRLGESLLAQYMAGRCAGAFSFEAIPVGEGLSGWVVQSKRPIVNGNPTVEPNYRLANSALSSDASALAIPLFAAHGGIFGVLTLYSHQQAAFSRDHVRMLEMIEPRFSLALEGALLNRAPDRGSEREMQPALQGLQGR